MTCWWKLYVMIVVKLPSPISAAFHWAISWQVWSVQIRWSWVSLKRAIFPFSHSFCAPDFVITHVSVGKPMIITIEEMFPSMRLNRKIKGGLCQNSRHSNDPKTDMDSAVRGCVRLSLKVLTIPLNSHCHQLSINPIFKAYPQCGWCWFFTNLMLRTLLHIHSEQHLHGGRNL